MELIARGGQLLTGVAVWGGAVVTELVRLPATIRQLRETVEVLAAMPAELERLAGALDATSTTIEAHVPELSRVVVHELGVTVDRLSAPVGELVTALGDTLPQVTEVLSTVPDQLARFDAVVAEVGAQLGAVLPKLEDVVIDELGDRVRHLDEVVSELSATLTSVMSAIPGVRRSVRTGGG